MENFLCLGRKKIQGNQWSMILFIIFFSRIHTPVATVFLNLVNELRRSVLQLDDLRYQGNSYHTSSVVDMPSSLSIQPFQELLPWNMLLLFHLAPAQSLHVSYFLSPTTSLAWPSKASLSEVTLVWPHHFTHLPQPNSSFLQTSSQHARLPGPQFLFWPHEPTWRIPSSRPHYHTWASLFNTTIIEGTHHCTYHITALSIALLPTSFTAAPVLFALLSTSVKQDTSWLTGWRNISGKSIRH